jgi:hypothetical protein
MREFNAAAWHFAASSLSKEVKENLLRVNRRP